MGARTPGKPGKHLRAGSLDTGETEGADYALRVLLMPTFRPAACITAFANGGVVALTARGEDLDGIPWSRRGSSPDMSALVLPLRELPMLPEDRMLEAGSADGCPTHVWARWPEGGWQGGGELAASPRMMFAVSVVVPVVASAFPGDPQIHDCLVGLQVYLQ